MNASRWSPGLAATLLMGAFGACLPAQVAELLPRDPQPAVVEGSYEVATRGPLHEAFASPYSSDPIAGVTINVAPPELIEEIPPEVAPEGDNVAWIPGYWGWEPDAGTFIWVSGIWRNAPPGQQWVPGYWTEVDGQYQWVSGFWTSEDLQALVYLPYPPESPEQGPVSAAPEGDYFWVPGTWLWVGNEYQWQPGYWARAYEEWIWNPAKYVWTPYGCVYTAGYWDFRPTERGIVFAPVHIRPAVAGTTIVRYTPQVVVQVPRTFVHWFVSPGHHHYYYGNYYGDRYARLNLMPWYTYQARAGYYDPLLTYYGWYYARQNVDFVDRLRRWNRYYTAYEDRRPPVTFAQQRQFFSRRGEDATAGQYLLAQTLDEMLEDRQDERRFRRLERDRRQQLAQASEALREVQRLRDRVERVAARQDDDRPGGREGGIRRLELPDEFRRGLRVNREQDRWQDRIADRRGPDGRDGDRPRGRDFAQGRGDERDGFEGRFEDRRRPDSDRDRERASERVRAARPITPDRTEEAARQEQPAQPDQQAQQPSERPDEQVQQPPAQPDQQAREPDRGERPDRQADRGPRRAVRPGVDERPLPDQQPDELDRRPRPDRGPVQAPQTRPGGERPADRLDRAVRPGQPTARPDQDVPSGEEARPGPDARLRPGARPGQAAPGQPPTQPELRGGDQARGLDGPRRGQGRGFDGRRLPLPRQMRADVPNEAAGGAEDASARRLPPFSARRGPARGPQVQREASPGRPFRGPGPLDQQPPEVDENDPRARAAARAERARQPAREAQPGRQQPGRGPAVERPGRDEGRRGAPERGNRGRPDRGQGDQPRPDREADEPENDDDPDD